MHITEGFLSARHAIGWWAASAPFLGYGFYAVGRTLKKNPQARLLLGASGGFAFVVSAFKLPSLATGSSSHATGIGLGAILFGPWVMCVLGTIVLLFQALFLGHGGLTTLGANAFSMAVVGSWVAYGAFHLSRRSGAPFSVAVFLAAALADLVTYGVTAVQLALWEWSDLGHEFAGSLVKFLGIFSLTQLPLAVAEGMLTVVVMNTLMAHSREELSELVSLPREKPS